jgi:hypothetical protein
MKYIFVAGAPGSKWSSVVKNIYYSPDIDRSDYRDQWTYYHDASGKLELMHLGAYFDPGMECSLPEDLTSLERSCLEKLFDLPFDNTATGVRIIKSHIFSYCFNLQHLRKLFPDDPVLLVHRSDDACLGWWVKCGHFGITYPSYHEYYKNLREMSNIIKRQNNGIAEYLTGNTSTEVENNLQLCDILNIVPPADNYYQDYKQNDIKVIVL